MIELTGWSDVLRGLGIVYWLLALGALAWALNKPKSGKNKAIAAAVVLVVFGALPFTGWLEGRKLKQAYQAQKALFDERCKNAGVKIYKTVDNVEGVLLLKVRPEHTETDMSDPLWPGAAFAQERGGEKFIETFLVYEKLSHATVNGKDTIVAGRGYFSIQPTDLPGYRFVDAIEEGGKRYRYRMKFWQVPMPGQPNYPSYKYELIRTETTEAAPRYAVTYEDDMNPKDRKNWVAGSTVKVLDMQTKDVLGEHTVYAVEYGRGNPNQRSPWFLSYVCGHSQGSTGQETRNFVDQVLKPIGNNSK